MKMDRPDADCASRTTRATSTSPSAGAPCLRVHGTHPRPRRAGAHDARIGRRARARDPARRGSGGARRRSARPTSATRSGRRRASACSRLQQERAIHEPRPAADPDEAPHVRADRPPGERDASSSSGRAGSSSSPADGSGKTTTLATMINEINQTETCHIITIEDPIEYYHEHKKAIITQREVGTDVPTFAEAMRRVAAAGPRRDPARRNARPRDDLAPRSRRPRPATSCSAPCTRPGSARTVDRIIDAFPAEQQEQIRAQLALSIIARDQPGAGAARRQARAWSRRSRSCSSRPRSRTTSARTRRSRSRATSRPGRSSGWCSSTTTCSQLVRDGQDQGRDRARARAWTRASSKLEARRESADGRTANARKLLGADPQGDEEGRPRGPDPGGAGGPAEKGGQIGRHPRPAQVRRERGPREGARACRPDIEIVDLAAVQIPAATLARVDAQTAQAFRRGAVPRGGRRCSTSRSPTR